jgi:hypothetical protein
VDDVSVIVTSEFVCFSCPIVICFECITLNEPKGGTVVVVVTATDTPERYTTSCSIRETVLEKDAAESNSGVKSEGESRTTHL